MNSLSTKLETLQFLDLSSARTRIDVAKLGEEPGMWLEPIQFIKCLEQKNDPTVHDTYLVHRTKGLAFKK